MSQQNSKETSDSNDLNKLNIELPEQWKQRERQHSDTSATGINTSSAISVAALKEHDRK